MVKKRDEGIELLRIIATFMVVMLHYINKGGVVNELVRLNLSSIWFVHLFRAFSMCAVNVFFLISGYFLINSKNNLKKIVKLWSQVLFYCIGILFIFLIVDKQYINVSVSINSLFPIITSTYWFITIYIIGYAIAPILNKILMNLSKEKFIRLIFISFLLLSIWPTIPFTDGLDLSKGYSLTQFLFLYVIGAYIRIFNFKMSKIKALVGYLSITVGMAIGCYLIGDFMNGLYSYNSVTVVISSICIFLYFKDYKIKGEFLCNIILKISQLTLGVYVIHEHPILRNGFLYNNILKTNLHYQTTIFPVIAILSVIMIFTICCVIDSFRLKIFSLLNSKGLFDYIYEKIVQFYYKFEKKVLNISDEYKVDI